MGPHRTHETQFSATSLLDVFALVDAASGVDVSQFDATFLAKSLDARIAATSSATASDYLDLLRNGSGEVGALLGALQVRYSEFFRDPLTFALLEQSVLPALIRQKAEAGGSEIRIWSAGCSTGQEAYSAAIILSELAESLDRVIPFSIIASDVSPDALAVAREGLYSQAAVGNIRLHQLDRWFTAEGSSYRVVPELRQHIDFSPYDLLDANSSCPPASIFGGFDIVLCCNVLFYYCVDARESITSKIRSSLAVGGYLVTGEAERDIVRPSGGFRGVVPSASVFRKLDSRR